MLDGAIAIFGRLSDPLYKNRRPHVSSCYLRSFSVHRSSRLIIDSQSNVCRRRAQRSVKHIRSEVKTYTQDTRTSRTQQHATLENASFKLNNRQAGVSRHNPRNLHYISKPIAISV